MPYLFNVADRDGVLDSAECSRKFHWALAGVAGSETAQHVDSGGYATVIEVLSGRKLWSIGVRDDGVFSNDTHSLARSTEFEDWQSIDRKGMRWETIVLCAGDRL